MRLFLMLCLLACVPLTAQARMAPAGQTFIDGSKILRGRFTAEHTFGNGQPPLRSSGHFVVAPAEGLIWGIEKPFPTLTIVTAGNAVQDIGGLAIKLPAKNLRHIFDMAGGALAGNWQALESDFILTETDHAATWRMLLTPRPGDQPKLPYMSVSVSGGRFVDTIVLAKADGGYDRFDFSDEVLSPAPPAPQEIAAFREAGR